MKDKFVGGAELRRRFARRRGPPLHFVSPSFKRRREAEEGVKNFVAGNPRVFGGGRKQRIINHPPLNSARMVL